MHAHIKYNSEYYKEAYTSKLKEAEYAYVLQRKADHHCIRISLGDLGGLAFTLLKSCYLTTITRYSK